MNVLYDLFFNLMHPRSIDWIQVWTFVQSINSSGSFGLLFSTPPVLHQVLAYESENNECSIMQNYKVIKQNNKIITTKPFVI